MIDTPYFHSLYLFRFKQVVEIVSYSTPKGTFDILPEETRPEDVWKASHRWAYLDEVMRKLSGDYGFYEIRTPIFEHTDLFVRGVGETSDIVSKEMYTFSDKAERSLSLRPEGTAPVARAFVQGGLKQLGSFHKLFYIGPFFRYDRPQAGRFRQFHQFGVEAIGKDDAEQDFEIIDMTVNLYKRLGIKNLNVLVNTLGDDACRKTYKEQLLSFLKPHFENLSPESQKRFTKNPLRILDSKDEKEQALLERAPTILDCLSPKSESRFASLTKLLENRGIPYTLAPKLVRGLDYYNETVFEVTSNVLGAQNTIGAGGRYNGLIKALGGQDLPAIGFSTGIERILKTMEGQSCQFPAKKGPFAYFVPLASEAKERALNMLYALRHNAIPAEITNETKIQKGLKKAQDIAATFAIVIGEEELQKGVAQIKTMETRKQEEVPFDQLMHFISEKWKTNGL